MNPPSAIKPTSPPSAGKKRPYQPEIDIPAATASTTSSSAVSPTATSGGGGGGGGGGSSANAFRNVSACNRCRQRKNRCDQGLPACSACAKARVECVGFDPITKREVPRSYVYFLETRVSYLEGLLNAKGVAYRRAEAFDGDSRLANNGSGVAGAAGEDGDNGAVGATMNGNGDEVGTDGRPALERRVSHKEEEEHKLDKLVSNIGMVSVQGASDPRFLGSTSGISFARVVFAAVKSSVSANASERGGFKPGPNNNVAAAIGSGQMRDSIFGLQTKPGFKQAPFPDKEVAARLVKNYFEYANPQLPILHRGEFMELFERAYSVDEKARVPRELYLLNIVFAIGAGIFFESENEQEKDRDSGSGSSTPDRKRQRLSGHQCQPEEYHAAAVVHMETLFGSSPDRENGFGGSLEELQAVLLLAGFALLRPVAPGLWYIVGVAVRLGVDLGLHYEDGGSIDETADEDTLSKTEQKISPDPTKRRDSTAKPIDAKERGRREWIRDLRRRLWWCIYSLDRLVSVCVGRPFGISDQAITTDFPSMLDDAYITKTGFLTPPRGAPSNKHVTYHYLKLRLLQSEINQVLQYQNAQIVLQSEPEGAPRKNHIPHARLKSPFLERFHNDFRSWRKDIDRRLWEWNQSSPTQQHTGVEFNPQFLELNYWQTVIMLYRQSLTVPPPLAAEMTPAGDYASPSMASVESREDEDDVFLKVAEAGQKTLRLYRQLHRMRLVNYTYLATHHLFMAGISFLYALWHSPLVRTKLTLDDVDFTVLAATSVLGDLMHKCPPAEACRDAFKRMSEATVQMCLSTTGFALSSDTRARQTSQNAVKNSQAALATKGSSESLPQLHSTKRPAPQFDFDFQSLFDKDTPRTFHSRIIQQSNLQAQSRAAQQPRAYEQSITAAYNPANQQRPPPSQSPEMVRVKQEFAQNQSSSGYPVHSGFAIPASPLSPTQQRMQQQQQQQQQSQPQQHSPSSQHHPSPTTQTQPYPYYPQQAQPQQYQPISQSDIFSMPGLDFLDTALDMDFSGPSATGANPGAGGIDLGFNNLDFGHDFSEGNATDIWGGFWFGGKEGGEGGFGGQD